MLFSGAAHAAFAALVATGTWERPTELPPAVVTVEILSPKGDSRGAVNAVRRPRTSQSPQPQLTDETSVAQAPSQPETTESTGSRLGSDDGVEGLVLSARQSYVAHVYQTLNEKKKYPEVARRLRQSGRVTLQFELSRNGRVQAWRILQASEFTPLNQATERLIHEVGQFAPFPEEISEEKWVLTVPVDYRL